MQSSDLLEFSKICDHKILNNILCRYKKVCNDLHIAFHADIRSNTTTFLSNSDVTSLFCNLLDNAVEASQRIKDPYIEISATQREHTPFIIITIINSCACNPFSPNGELVSSKPDPQAHGFGIKSIEKLFITITEICRCTMMVKPSLFTRLLCWKWSHSLQLQIFLFHAHFTGKHSLVVLIILL